MKTSSKHLPVVKFPCTLQIRLPVLIIDLRIISASQEYFDCLIFLQILVKNMYKIFRITSILVETIFLDLEICNIYRLNSLAYLFTIMFLIFSTTHLLKFQIRVMFNILNIICRPI
uniref:Uncharacterized protein n=1 Tax=Heterorhabditis bacteriophora TaxID=37862 RepID=A0A1I7WUM4_HETBA